MSPPKVDVLHAVWETYKGRDCHPRPTSGYRGGQGLRAASTGLQAFSVCTRVGRAFVGISGLSRVAAECSTSELRLADVAP